MRLLYAVLHVLICCEIHGELYSALSGMEALLETDGILLRSLYTYVTYHEDRIKLLRKRYDIHSSDYEIAKKDPTTYLSNPINAFKIIKDLIVDWKITEEIFYNDKTTDILENLKNLKSSLVYPDKNDLVGAVDGLIRLQEVYHLDTAELSDGIINGKRESTPMSTSDCYIMGHQASALDLPYSTLEWMNVALSKYEIEQYDDTVLKSRIQEYRALAQYNIGDITAAINTTQESLLLSPDDLRQVENLAVYEHLKKKMDAEELLQSQNKNDKMNFKIRNFDELCRDEVDVPEHIKKDLKCRYESESPFLRLAPVKVEEYYLDPYIAVFHDVIYEDEIKVITEIAKTKLTRAMVLDSKIEVGTKVGYRVTKVAWLWDDEHEILRRINQRIEDITGLYMKTAEPLQAANYGIGGHYLPHVDSSLNDDKFGFIYENDGNRIATLVFYLSDVDQGGRTVFPEVGTGVTPRKGSALFWYNLHSSGETDRATLHGACPVLLGSKWIANKWIRQRGQKGLCDLDFVKEGLKKEYPEPVPKLKANEIPK